MSVASRDMASRPPLDQAVLSPVFLDPALIETQADNPVYTEAELSDLLASYPVHGQLEPAHVCPSQTEGKFICLDGARRLAVCRILGLQYWAFVHPEYVPDAGQIVRTFHHNYTRRRMSPEEVATRAARFLEIDGGSNANAAKHLNISTAALSRALGEDRIPEKFRARTALLGRSVRWLISAVPESQMEEAISFAETIGPNGKPPIRDQVSVFIRELKKSTPRKSSKPKAITLRQCGRAVTLTVTATDNAETVAADFRAIAAKLGKDAARVPPEGWPFLFP
jgi:ParB/RepB/Spo0J family partition protein